jgi:hypothetical protein
MHSNDLTGYTATACLPNDEVGTAIQRALVAAHLNSGGWDSPPAHYTHGDGRTCFVVWHGNGYDSLTRMIFHYTRGNDEVTVWDEYAGEETRVANVGDNLLAFLLGANVT